MNRFPDKLKSWMGAVAARRKMFVRYARNFMLLRVGRIVNDLVDARVRNFVARLKNLTNGSHRESPG